MRDNNNDNGIIVRNPDTALSTRAQEVGEDALKAQNWEATFVALVMGIGLVAASGEVLDLVGFELSTSILRQIILMNAIFGVIVIPRLTLVSEITRLILLMLIIGQLALFTRLVVPGDQTLVYGGALMLLFMSSIINALVQREDGESAAHAATTGSVLSKAKDGGLMSGVFIFALLV